MATDRTQPVLVNAAEPLGDGEPRIKPRPSRTMSVMLIAIVLAAFWVGATVFFLAGYYGGLQNLMALDLPKIAQLVAVSLVPALLFLSTAWALTRAQAMGAAAEALVDATDRLFTADETAARTTARLGRAVRRELDALNAGLDGAFTRLRALESVLENQIAALDEAGARVDVRGEAVAARLTQERERIQGVADTLADAAARAGETVAGRAAQLKSTIEAAEGALKAAGQSLDTQAANFRQAAGAAADAPHAATVELDKQAKRIEAVSDAAMARAEFVLGRQERHRTAMNDLMGRLKEEGVAFEKALAGERATMEQAIAALGQQAQRFESVSGEAERHLELLMVNATGRTQQLTQNFSREAEKLREAADAANTTLAHLINALHEAGSGAQNLIGETASQAKADTRALVGEAMAECERLLRTAGELSSEAGKIRTTLAQAVDEVEKHLLTLPGVAQQEAQRVRAMVKRETEEILDLSARTLSTIHARSAPGPTARTKGEPEPAESEGLLGLAKKLTQRPKQPAPKKGLPGDPKNWQMSTLLAAVETGEARKELKPAAAAALGALEAALADMAIDLEAIAGGEGPDEEEWKRYLAGDRTVFARKLSGAIDAEAVNRIAVLYRENTRFRDCANAYMEDFESLLGRAREGDGGGLLASTLLSADTGKIYLAIAYALGRL